MLQVYFYICAWSASVLYFTVPAYLYRECDKSVIMLFGMFHNQSVWLTQGSNLAYFKTLLWSSGVCIKYLLPLFLDKPSFNFIYMVKCHIHPSTKEQTIRCTDSRNRSLTKRDWLRDDRTNESAQNLRCRTKQFAICTSKVILQTTCFSLVFIILWIIFRRFYFSLKVFHSFKYSRSPVKQKVYHFHGQPSNKRAKENKDCFFCTEF